MNDEDRKIAPPTQLHGAWKGWLAAMPTVERAWPFPVSATADGWVRNVPPPKRTRRRAPKAPASMPRCEVGARPSVWSTHIEWNYDHRWPRPSAGVPLASLRCRNCGKTRAELLA